MARDWLSAFRDASFRGVPFKVAREVPAGGRRVAVHEISGGEAPVTEDVGRRARGLRVDAYVVGDEADGAGLALEAALDAYGPAPLILPMDPFQIVHCQDWRRRREKDRAGYIAYDLDFVIAGNGVASLGSPVAALDAVFEASVAAVASAIGAVS